MSTETENAVGLYVYAFIHARDCQAVLDANIKGIHDASIEVIVVQDLAVVLSPICEKKIRPQRKFLAAHQDVVTRLSREWSMLPVSFGLIADDQNQVQYVLSANAEPLQSQLERVEEHVEMSLTLQWSTENVVQYFVDRYQDLKEARDLIASGNASRDDQIELGRLFEKRLSSERTMHTDKILNVFEEICREVTVQSPKAEKDIVRMACLVHRDSVPRFEKAIYQIAEAFNEEFAFSFNGPWPPYSFVNLALSMEQS